MQTQEVQPCADRSLPTLWLLSVQGNGPSFVARGGVGGQSFLQNLIVFQLIRFKCKEESLHKKYPEGTRDRAEAAESLRREKASDFDSGPPASADDAKQSCISRFETHLAKSAAATFEDDVWSLSKHVHFFISFPCSSVRSPPPQKKGNIPFVKIVI